MIIREVRMVILTDYREIFLLCFFLAVIIAFFVMCIDMLNNKLSEFMKWHDNYILVALGVISLLGSVYLLAFLFVHTGS